MRARCDDPENKDYGDYGGRGITVCVTWRASYQSFADHVTELPHFGEKGYSLDRINNNGNYELGNVRWATKIEQMRNRRSARMLTYKGRTQSVSAWADEIDIPASLIRSRLDILGWSIECALTTPPLRWWNRSRKK